MFNWICPTCGREVPPSKTDCPDCAERARQAAAQSVSTEQGRPAYPEQEPVAPSPPPHRYRTLPEHEDAPPQRTSYPPPPYERESSPPPPRTPPPSYERETAPPPPRTPPPSYERE